MVSEGWLSLWAATEPTLGVPPVYLEGGDALWVWLDVDFGVGIDGAFSTNYTRHGDLVPLDRLLAPLPGAEGFSTQAVAAGRSLGVERVSFVVALYDCAYAPPGAVAESSHLRFVGAFRYR